MNIQPTSFTKNHLINNNGANAIEDYASIKKRREDLTRRPSYRKIFNDIADLSQQLDTQAPPGPPPIHNSTLANNMPSTLMAGVNQLAAPVPISAAQQQQQQLAVNRPSPQLSHVTTNVNQIVVTQQSSNTSVSSSPSPQSLDHMSAVGVDGAATNLHDPNNQTLANSQSPLSLVGMQGQTVGLGPITTSSASITHQQFQQQQQQHSNQRHPLQPQHHHQHPSLSPVTTPTTTAGTTTSHILHRHHHQQPQTTTQQLLTLSHHQAPQAPHLHHQHHAANQMHLHQHQQQQQILPPTSPSSISGNSTSNLVIGGEEATKKREMRLQKNREAAKECRRKKKEYIKCLENRIAVLENQNKALIDELKSLKDLYCKSTNE